MTTKPTLYRAWKTEHGGTNCGGGGGSQNLISRLLIIAAAAAEVAVSTAATVTQKLAVSPRPIYQSDAAAAASASFLVGSFSLSIIQSRNVAKL